MSREPGVGHVTIFVLKVRQKRKDSDIHKVTITFFFLEQPLGKTHALLPNCIFYRKKVTDGALGRVKN